MKIFKRKFSVRDLKYIFLNIFLNNFWLKIISLILAIGLWLYVNGELSEGIRL